MKPLKLLNTFLKMRSKRYLLSRLLEVVLGYPLYVFSFCVFVIEINGYLEPM